MIPAYSKSDGLDPISFSEKISDISYEIKHVLNTEKIVIVHVDHLKAVR